MHTGAGCKAQGAWQFTKQSFFYHFPNPNFDDVKKKYALPDYNVVDGDTMLPENIENIRQLVLNGTFLKSYAAFTVSEMAAMLQRYSNDIFFHNPTKLWSQKASLCNNMFRSQAACYGNYLVICLEQKIISVKEANIRLQTFHDGK